MDIKKETKKESKKFIILLVLGLGILIALSVGFTYAYYVFSGNFTSGDTTTAATFDIETTLDSTAAISNTNMMIIDEADIATKADKFSFTIKNANSSTVNGNFLINLIDINISDNLYDSAFKWQLLNGATVVASGNFSTLAKTATTLTLNSTAINLAPGISQNLTLRIWLQNDPNNNQMQLINGSFQARITVEATPIK